MPLSELTQIRPEKEMRMNIWDVSESFLAWVSGKNSLFLKKATPITDISELIPAASSQTGGDVMVSDPIISELRSQVFQKQGWFPGRHRN